VSCGGVSPRPRARALTDLAVLPADEQVDV
jgi:hypothetical protein